jgi:hypothetical protein
MTNRPRSGGSTMVYKVNLRSHLINDEYFDLPRVLIKHWISHLNEDHSHWNYVFIRAHNLPINESHRVAFKKKKNCKVMLEE